MGRQWRLGSRQGRAWCASSRSGALGGGSSKYLPRSSGDMPLVSLKKRWKNEPSSAHSVVTAPYMFTAIKQQAPPVLVTLGGSQAARLEHKQSREQK